MAALLFISQSAVTVKASHEELDTKESYAFDEEGNIYKVNYRLLDTSINSMLNLETGKLK